jgi:hypothetical protein
MDRGDLRTPHVRQRIVEGADYREARAIDWGVVRD